MSAHTAPFGAAALVLTDGTVFRGRPLGAFGRAIGCAALATTMTGYQAALTDEIARQKILIFTTPHIGNVGWSAPDDVRAQGLVIRDSAPHASHYLATSSLPGILRAQHIVGICQVDTRALTRKVANQPQFCGIFSAETPAVLPDLLDMVAHVRNAATTGEAA